MICPDKELHIISSLSMYEITAMDYVWIIVHPDSMAYLDKTLAHVMNERMDTHIHIILLGKREFFDAQLSSL